MLILYSKKRYCDKNKDEINERCRQLYSEGTNGE